MNKYITSAVMSVLALGLCAAEVTVNPPAGEIRGFNGNSTDRYSASRVEAKLNVNIKDATQKIHFVRDNSDPYVVTKAYTIKNADAFTLRGVLKTIVSGSIVNNPVQMDSVMYNDGIGVLLVSAEEYRFKNVGNGMSMDEIVASLDKKGLANSYGTIDMAYFPKYNPASVLLSMMRESKIGFTQASQTVKAKTFNLLDRSTDPDLLSYALTDDKMNVIVMTAAGYDVAEALHFLKEVDTPAEEILLNYKVVEIYAENDQKLGLDFQAWKNNDGMDLFSAGGKYGTNWGPNGLTPNTGYRYAEYYNFNPKWNTKYVDFLTVCGKAKIVSSGSLQVANGGTANLNLADGLFSIVTKEYKDSSSEPKKTVTTTKTEGNTTTTTTEEYGPKTSLIPWTLESLLPATDDGKHQFNRKNIPSVVLNQEIYKGQTQEVEQQQGNLFQLSIGGDVHPKASNLSVALASTSLIGWDGQGKARMTRSGYSTVIQIGSEKKEFVIGGLTKQSVVRSSTGLPFLKDLPVIGWIFSTETDTVKKSQYVVIATAELVKSSAVLNKEARTEIDKIQGKVDKAVKNPMGTLGFQQLWIDKK